jgi:hypothetical protein
MESHIPFTTTSLQSQGDEGDGSKKTNIFADIFEVIVLVFSFTIQFGGAALSLGLVLNLCGYVYSFDFKRGLEIDTIDNRRKEVQFQREIIRTSKVQENIKVVEDIPSSFREPIFITDE